jgi:hypothetical protein
MTSVNLGDSLRRLVFQRSFKGVSAHIKGLPAGLNENQAVSGIPARSSPGAVQDVSSRV